MSSYKLLEAIERSRRQFVKVTGGQPESVRISPHIYSELLATVAVLLKDQGKPGTMERIVNLSGCSVVVNGPEVPPFEHFTVEEIDAS